MTLRLVTDTLFGVDALVGWCSSVTLLYISQLSMAETITQLAAAGGTIVALGSGFFSMLKLREGWLSSRAKRKMVEMEVEEMEHENQ